MLEAYKTNFVLMTFCKLGAMLTDRHRRKPTSKRKKNSKLGTGY